MKWLPIFLAGIAIFFATCLCMAFIAMQILKTVFSKKTIVEEIFQANISVWFLALIALGLASIFRAPTIVLAGLAVMMVISNAIATKYQVLDTSGTTIPFLTAFTAFAIQATFLYGSLKAVLLLT